MGGPGDRTHYPGVTSAMLYQLSYRGPPIFPLRFGALTHLTLCFKLSCTDFQRLLGTYTVNNVLVFFYCQYSFMNVKSIIYSVLFCSYVIWTMFISLSYYYVIHLHLQLSLESAA
ncbi:hypothetical protein J4Q44_G00248210 [Coregonus suidteri]|uniref:Uncharacterized protein n=1 Tax=Coregonus suidteri TaxID=861788 RepID=A0AAN8QGU9_9TELE